MKTLITRVDDFASSAAANAAIAGAAGGGFVKNVSTMAVCGEALVAGAAELLAHREDLCFGLHITLNAEWDRVRWGPLTAAPSLRDAEGCFYRDPRVFAEKTPDLDEVMAEIEAQYALLVRAGFKLAYAEAHMLPERYFPGLQARIRVWAAQKGLLDFCYYLGSPLPQMDALASTPGLFREVLAGLGGGQYLYLAHPALYGPEMCRMGNAAVPGEQLARMRAMDAAFVAAPETLEACLAAGVTPIRLDEAKPGPYRVLVPGPIF